MLLRLTRQLRMRPRLLFAIAFGIAVGSAAGIIWPDAAPPLTRALLGWDAGVWCYLLAALAMMVRADHSHLQRTAIAQADGRGAVLLLAVLGAMASLAALAVELPQFGSARASLSGWACLLLAVSTVIGSWLLLPVEFALNYASLYHRGPRAPHGLEFPGGDGDPDYTDIMYFAITLAATSQTSDVAVSSRPMRRLVLMQAALSFLFNTGVLALAVGALTNLLK